MFRPASSKPTANARPLASPNCIEELARRCCFRDCSHVDEPGCEVQLALREGRLDTTRLDHWHTLQREIQHLELKRDVAARRRQDRALGRFYKRVLKAKRSR